jgi:tryptophan synthase beta chain
MHQTIIGLEAQKQLAIVGDYPDVVIGCVGGGSNFAGIAFPFLRDKIHGKEVKVIGCEPASCPTMTKGTYVYDFGDTARRRRFYPCTRSAIRSCRLSMQEVYAITVLRHSYPN